MQTETAVETKRQPTGLVLRPFEPVEADYTGLVAVNNGAWPDMPTSMEAIQHREKNRDPRYFFDRWLAEVDGEVAAAGFLQARWWSYAPGKYSLEIEVRPEFRGRGIGTALWNLLFELARKRGANDFQAYTREDQPGAIRFLEKRGYQRLLREPCSVLDVRAFDPAPFKERLARAQAAGLTIRSAAQLMESDPDFKQKIYDLEVVILQDVPMSEEFTPPAFEQWIKRFDSPNFIPETWMVGLDGETYVGLSRLMGDDVRQDKLWTGMTGTRREFRRYGLATALKIAGILAARERGVIEIETDNEENNPMYQLNLQLGFKPAPAWLEYGLKLDGVAG